ncbi:MAG: hypothetical protein [Circular genetic element sp.]|nr:MAG: hypothetical protein [Circular genetic element sp.]
MPTYVVVPNDPKTFPDYAYNEVIVDTQVGSPTWNNPLHNVDLDIYLTGYNRIYITTEYIDMGMSDRKDASYYYYHGPLASTNPIPPGKMREYVKYGKPDMGLIESRRDSSLSSKSKTRGKKRPNVYTPKRGQRCKAGYTNIDGKCVLIMSSLHKSLMY